MLARGDMRIRRTLRGVALRARSVFRGRTMLWAMVALAPALALAISAYQRRWMDDDGFINLRIARNWLHGLGPVFNIDERVEAATSPLWLLVLTGLGSLGLPLQGAAVGAGITLTVAGLLLGQAAAWRIHHRGAPAAFWQAPTLPIGAAIVAALPPVWDYASGGLETGLGLAWLGATYWAVARHTLGLSRSLKSACAVAALAGIGPAVRPEFALYSVAFLLVLAWSAFASAGWRTLGRLALIAGSASAAPVICEVLRMGYYGVTVPNTALAKEAFLANWKQGYCYFHNFVHPYGLLWPMAAALSFWQQRLRACVVARRRLAAALVIAPVVAAAIHVVFLVRIGGDYMHGRLLVSPLFAALLPVMTVPAQAPEGRSRQVVLALCGVAVGAWVVVCAAGLRVAVDNECDIGDERGWYARSAQVDNPVDVDAFRRHPFFDGSMKWLKRIHDPCPPFAATGNSAGEAQCRRVFLDDDKPQIAPSPAAAPLATAVDSRVSAVVPSGAIGLLGYILPDDVHVVDLHGLSEPIAARLELVTRGRPGHEKKLTAPWILARFSEPAADEDASVTAARHALACGGLSSALHALSAPMSVRVFSDNLAEAWASARLRIPRDPFDAEAKFCDVAPLTSRTTGGGGGSAFRWRCPPGSALYGVRGSVKEGAVAHVQPLCRGTTNPQSMGPVFGETSSAPFEVACPPDSIAVGMYGGSDHLVRSLGMLCSESAVLRGARGGVDGSGRPFSLECPGERAARGVEGRSGSLIDSIGVLCDP